VRRADDDAALAAALGEVALAELDELGAGRVALGEEVREAEAG
jgi:hypothetical protein